MGAESIRVLCIHSVIGLVYINDCPFVNLNATIIHFVKTFVTFEPLDEPEEIAECDAEDSSEGEMKERERKRRRPL